jgi:hypothetical protein
MAGVERRQSRHQAQLLFYFIFLFKSLSSNDEQLNALQGKE